MTRSRVTVWLYGVVSVLCFAAALIPVVKGGRLNVVYLACGVVFLAVAVARAKALTRRPDATSQHDA